MFTGIIEAIGTLKEVQQEGSNRLLTFVSPISKELKIDQSIAHNGVCLTATQVKDDFHQAVAVAETLQKSNLGSLKPGDKVNLERSLTLQQHIDGHLLQGHVDATGTCTNRIEKNGSVEFRFQFPPAFSHLVIEKGAIALNGISLTIFDVSQDAFSIAVIPYTYENTTLHLLQPGDTANLEFDLIGKYVARLYAKK